MRGSTQQKGEQGGRNGESTCLSPMCRGLDSRTGVICGLSLLVVLFLAPRGFSPGILTLPLSSLTKVSKFQFDLDYCQSLYHESMTPVIAQALPVIYIKFALTFFWRFVITRVNSLYELEGGVVSRRLWKNKGLVIANCFQSFSRVLNSRLLSGSVRLTVPIFFKVVFGSLSRSRNSKTQ